MVNETMLDALDELTARIQRYNQLMRELDTRLREVEALRKEAAELRASFETAAEALRNTAPSMPEGVVRILFYTYADCIGVANA